MKNVKKVTVFERGAEGALVVKEVRTTKSKKKRKKGTPGVSFAEKIVRTAASVNATVGQSYVDRHNRSNRKKRDGWVIDAPANLIKSGMKGMKKVRISTFI